MPDAAPALSDPLTPTSLDADGAMLEHRLFDGQACTCPLCTGQVTLEDTQPAQLDAPQAPLGDVFGAQDYLNADDRAAITNVEGKPSFTIDRAALQLTGYRTIFSSTGTTLVPERVWSAQAGLPFTVTYGFRATQPFD